MVAAANDRLTSLYRMYGPIIYSRCARILGDRAAAEDALQETFIRVHRHLDKAPSSAEALTWIYRIATNYCLNEVRNRKLRPQSEPELPELPVTVANLDDVLADRDLVAQIILRCPKQVRSIAWLHYIDGLDQGEVARVCGVSRRTVVNRLAELAQNARQFITRSAS
jgi:RNA polymerase sigma-70 factor (ECF subfamily)